jgi:tetratricopeptide (TPR) repeat protein
MRPKEAAPKARAAALKALALDSTLAEAHAALAYVTMYYDWDWPRADRQLRRAIELNPSYSRAHRRYAHSLVCVGLPDSAIAEAERGLALDPLDRASNFDLGVVLLQARRYDRALDHARRLAESDPDYELGYLLLGFVHEGRGMLREAAEAYRRVRGEQVAALLWTGQRDSALKLLAQREQDATRQFVPPYSLAVDYARAGEKDKAFEWLERAYAERVGWLITMHVDPRFDPLRSDPRFVRLLKRINLRT